MGMKPEYTMKRMNEDGFIERLKNIATTRYYDYQLPCEIKPCTSGSLMWKSEPEQDPWMNLLAAVISSAAYDYVDALIYERKFGRPHWTKQYAEEYLAQWSPEILDRLKYEVRIAERSGIRGLERMGARMKVMY